MQNSAEADLIRQGIELFNQGEFFACHEVLEQAWLGAHDERKFFIQGLIQIAVAFYHLRRGNTVGAERLLSAGVGKLQSNAAAQVWIESAALLTEVAPVLRALQAGTAACDAPHPQVRLLREHP